MLADTRQRLSEREMVVAAQTKKASKNLRTSYEPRRRSCEPPLTMRSRSTSPAPVRPPNCSASSWSWNDQHQRTTNSAKRCVDWRRQPRCGRQSGKNWRERRLRRWWMRLSLAQSTWRPRMTKRALQDEIQHLRDQLTAHDWLLARSRPSRA